MIYLIREGFLTWISEIKSYGKDCFIVRGEEFKKHIKILFQAYVDLFEAFNIFKIIYTYTLLILFLDAFCFILISVQTETEIIHNKFCEDEKLYAIAGTAMSIWILKKMLYTILFSIFCEKLYMTVCEADVTCICLRSTIQNSGTMMGVGQDSSNSNKKFINMLLPLRCMQHIIFLSTFTVQDNSIKAHTGCYYVFSFICILSTIIIRLVIIKPNCLFSNLSWATNFINNNVGNVLLCAFFAFFFITFLGRNDYLNMILRTQHSFKELNYKQYKKLTIWNWAVVCAHLIYFMLNSLFFCDLHATFLTYVYVCFDINVTIGLQIVTLIKEGVTTWTFEVEYHCLMVHDEECERYVKKMFRIYVDLVEAFDKFKRMYQFVIFVFLLDVFSLILIFAQMVIEIEKYNVSEDAQDRVVPFMIGTIIWIMRRMLFIIFFSIYCENFYITLYETDATCSCLLNSSQRIGGIKRLCKNVQRLNRAAFHKMRACHIFTVDGRLPQEFCCLVFGYIVVLIQFAY